MFDLQFFLNSCIFTFVMVRYSVQLTKNIINLKIYIFIVFFLNFIMMYRRYDFFENILRALLIAIPYAMGVFIMKHFINRNNKN